MNSTNELFRVGEFSIQLAKNTRWNSFVSHECQKEGFIRSFLQPAHINTHCVYCSEPLPEEIRTVWILHNFDLIGDKK